MKALFTSAIAMLLVIQISCATNPASQQASQAQLPEPQMASAKIGADLPTPEVAVMPTKEGILIAWKPITEADGYFVFRETQSPPSKTLLGIGPKEAQGFIDRNPPENDVKYSVQAFKTSERSTGEATTALPGAASESQRSDSLGPTRADANGLPVLRKM
jgi:hypothetical protein